jgi:anti-anti-sigma regulatory factor
MALNFKPLKLQNPDLFGVRLSGSVGRGDRDRLKELADKCLVNGKVRVVLDLSELGSMGGGGARMIAELQERLQAAEGGAVIAGAGDTVKRFLDQKLEGDPLAYYASVDEAVASLAAAGNAEPAAVATAVAEPETDAGPEPGADLAPEADLQETALETGAVGFAEGEADGEMDDLLGEFTVEQTRQGRRRDHHYASLTEALDALTDWSDRDSQLRFNDTLKNLLFSQGLAQDVTLLMSKGGLLISPDGYKEIPLGGSLAIQAEQVARPMTMLDVRDENLSEEELSLLEIVDPDMILPVLCRGTLRLLIMAKRGGEEREYDVAENFAFELLQQILQRTEEAKLERHHPPVAPARPTGGKAAVWEGILLRMALEMPEADDLPHFWRLFAHHLEPMMALEEMSFLGAGETRPRTMLGGGGRVAALDCSEPRLQKYFQAMERPVEVDNLPATFAALQQELQAAGVNWIIGLRHEDQFLGTLMCKGVPGGSGRFTENLVGVFTQAARLMQRCDDLNDDTDLGLELLRRMVGQREKRFFGSDIVTATMVQQLVRLAREMGFAADQKRDLVYGCLLRDVGLIDKDDALMGSPADMTPAQWKAYRNHPTDGASLLGDLDLSQTVIEVVKCHHERFNGEGFPAGLSGRDIPLAARVVTVVENYVAMITGAGGLEPRSPEEAAAVLRENLGERYDPDIVSVFLSVADSR